MIDFSLSQSGECFQISFFIGNTRYGTAGIIPNTNSISMLSQLESLIDLKNYSVLVGVSILNKYQNKGFGSKMIQEILDVWSPLLLWVDINNVPAIQCYKKAGFKVIHELELSPTYIMIGNS